MLIRNYPNTVKLDGSSGSVNIADNVLLRPGTGITLVSIAQFYGYYSGTCLKNLLIAKGFDPTNGHYEVGVNDTGGCGAATNVKHLVGAIKFSDGSVISIEGTTNLFNTATRSFNMYAVTFDQASQTMNGYLTPTSLTPPVEATATVTGKTMDTTSCTDSVYIGRQNGGSFSYLSKIYTGPQFIFNRALTGAELANIWFNGIIPSGLIFGSYMTDGSGNATDISGNGFNGTLAGGATWSSVAWLKGRTLL